MIVIKIQRGKFRLGNMYPISQEDYPLVRDNNDRERKYIEKQRERERQREWMRDGFKKKSLNEYISYFSVVKTSAKILPERTI